MLHLTSIFRKTLSALDVKINTVKEVVPKLQCHSPEAGLGHWLILVAFSQDTGPHGTPEAQPPVKGSVNTSLVPCPLLRMEFQGGFSAPFGDKGAREQLWACALGRPCLVLIRSKGLFLKTRGNYAVPGQFFLTFQSVGRGECFSL